MTVTTIAKALGGRKAGAAWMARCPAHDDREPSLSIADGDDGKVLVRCHAGCEQHRVIAALGGRSEGATVRANPLKTNDEVAADGADANIPRMSATGKNDALHSMAR